MSDELRRGIENGIWLCRSCASEIDGDEVTWTVEVLKVIKAAAEQRARVALGVGHRRSRLLSLEASRCHFIRDFQAAFVPVHIVNEGPEAVSISDVRLVVDGVVHRPSVPPCSLSVGMPWLHPAPLRLRSNGADRGAWYFGQSWESGGSPVVGKPGSSAELHVSPVGHGVIRRQLQFMHPDAAIGLSDAAQ